MPSATEELLSGACPECGGPFGSFPAPRMKLGAMVCSGDCAVRRRERLTPEKLQGETGFDSIWRQTPHIFTPLKLSFGGGGSCRYCAGESGAPQHVDDLHPVVEGLLGEVERLAEERQKTRAAMREAAGELGRRKSLRAEKLLREALS